MQNVPEVCYSICGAAALVSVVALLVLARMARNAPLRNDWQ